MKTLNGCAALAAMALVLAGCRGIPTSEIVGLYDDASETGGIEIEMDRDGSIREVEADIEIADLPKFVVDAARKRLPNGQIIGAEREIQVDGRVWEVKMRDDGRVWEFVIDDLGRINETERELSVDEAPRAALSAAETAIPNSTFKSVEVIEHSTGAVEFHVKRLRNGVSYKVVLTGDGTILRKVREHRAEIEIPLSE